MTRGILVALLIACGCGHLGARPRRVTSVPAVTVNVRDFGAVPDDDLDDRVALQSALDAGAGGVVLVPSGTYIASQHPRSYWCLNVHPGTTIRGESRDGAVIRMGAGAGLSVQLLEVLQAPDVTITNLTLDGAKDQQTVLGVDQNGAPIPDPHRANLFAKQSPRLTMRGVTTRNATGDGVEIYDGSNDPDVYDVLATGNLRNGLTLGGGTTGGMFAASQFVGNGAQQFDSEGNTVSGVTIRGCLFDGAGVSGDYVLTMTGMGSDLMSHGWTVTDNVVNGSALMVWITEVVYARNTGTNPTGKPSVRVYRTADRIRIQDNVLTTTADAAFDAGAMIYITGTGAGQAPGGVIVSGNVLTTTGKAFGVSAICARDVTIVDNVMLGASRPGDAGVFVRATKADAPVVLALIQRNRITGFGGYGVLLGGNGTAQIQRVDISGNTFAGTGGLYLGDDTNAARFVTASENTGIAIARPPGGAWQAWGDGGRWTMGAP